MCVDFRRPPFAEGWAFWKPKKNAILGQSVFLNREEWPMLAQTTPVVRRNNHGFALQAVTEAVVQEAREAVALDRFSAFQERGGTNCELGRLVASVVKT